MTKLTNKGRDACVQFLLKEAFTPRFLELKARVLSTLLRMRNDQHAPFVKILNDESSWKYLAVINGPKLRTLHPDRDDMRRGLYLPAFDMLPMEGDFPTYSHMSRSNGYSELTDKDTPYPVDMQEVRLDRGHEVVLLHDQLWNEFLAAQTRLVSLLQGYVSREKFEADFPDLARGLPPRVVKMALPSVDVKSVRKELSEFGIPPGDTDGSHVGTKGEAS